MKPAQSTRVMFFLVALAIVLAVGFAVLLVRQEMERRRSGIEYQVYRIMTGIMDVYSSGDSFDPAQWPELSGFGVYGKRGVPQYRYGTAPAHLDTPELIPPPGISTLTGTSMSIIRRIGAIPGLYGDGMFMPRHLLRPFGSSAPMIGNASGAAEGSDPMGGMMPPGPSVMRTGRESRYVFIDLDVAMMLHEGRLVLLAVSVLLAIFLSIVSIMLVYSRKIAVYQAREQQTSHLVQLGEAARTLAHEIKNPLGVIRVQCATLRRTVPEERLKNIDVIEEETARLVLLTDRLRDFLHNSVGMPVPCDPVFFAEQCRRRYEGRLLVDPVSVSGLAVFIDPDRLMQVLDNLISNALEASSPDSEIPQLAVTSRRNVVSFSVSDRGCGVAPENRARLFEPFFTTKARGSGIGLALARRYMEQAGGFLVYTERSGGGSSFTASLSAMPEGRSQ